MMPPVTRVSGSRAETASGSGDSELLVLDNVIMIGVKGQYGLPETLVIREESVPCAVSLRASIFVFTTLKYTYPLCVP